jgi:hypothetical protein
MLPPLALLLASPMAAEAQQRSGARPSAAAMAAARAFLCPNGGTPQRGGRCRRVTGSMGNDPAIIGWDRGLPAPTRTQRACPPGTTEQPARDQADITRCVPG